MSQDTYKLAILMRNSGAVKRYHTVRTLREQTVAAHSWGVAALVLCIQPQPSAALLTAALMHDMAEVYTGDIPATAKWASEHLTDALKVMERLFESVNHVPDNSLTKEELHVLKWCDLAELTFWCIEESGLGNAFIIPLIKRGCDKIIALGHPTQDARDLFDYLMHAASGDVDDMAEYDYASQ